MRTVWRVRERALIVVRARPRNLDFSMAVEKPPKVVCRSMGCILDKTRCGAVAPRLEQRLEEAKTGLPVQPRSSLAHSRAQPYQGPPGSGPGRKPAHGTYASPASGKGQISELHAIRPL